MLLCAVSCNHLVNPWQCGALPPHVVRGLFRTDVCPEAGHARDENRGDRVYGRYAPALINEFSSTCQYSIDLDDKDDYRYEKPERRKPNDRQQTAKYDQIPWITEELKSEPETPVIGIGRNNS